MKIIESFLTKNDCFKANRSIKPTGLMLHSVGCSQPSAEVFVKSWNKSGLQACVHGFIDGNSGIVFQTLPWTHRGWHGGGSSNNSHIGVEMCEPDTIKYIGGSSFQVLNREKAIKVVETTYNAAVELFAFLCKEYNLNPLKSGVIVSHSEGCKLGIASNHGDPEHLWRGLGLPYTMETFRKAVAEQIGKAEEKKMLTTPNDITWELNHTYFPITETRKFVEELEVAKNANSSLYWGYYKLVNKIK